MAKYTFKCRDMGMDCDFETTGKSVDEIMPRIVEHAKTAHNITTIDDAMKQKVNSAIKKKMF